MHIHQFTEITNPTNKKNRTRLYRCKCGYTLEERKIESSSYYYVVSKENKT